MRAIVRLGAVLLFLIFPASLVLAKDTPDKITVTGPGLSGPLEITDPEILAASNPWADEFVDWGAARIDETLAVDRRYEILVQVHGEDGRFHVMYAFEYAPDPSGRRGYIYLPGRDDKWYDLNAGTILRPTGWQRASAEWNTIMEGILRANAAPSSSGVFVPLGIRAIESPVVLGLALATAAGGTALWLIRRRGAAHA